LPEQTVAGAFALPKLAPTPRAVIRRDGPARLLRFGAPADAPTTTPAGALKAGELAAGAGDMPVLVVPSMINRWYIVDLRAGSSLVGALVGAGLNTFCLDWGRARDEDRYFTWDDVIARLARAVRWVRRYTGAPRVALVGYCMGATLAGIYAALQHERVGALVNLLGPFDFSEAGDLGHSVDKRWFDPAALTAAGNLSALQMQSGFVAMRPTAQLAKWVTLADRWQQPDTLQSFAALETWANDNVPFPAAAYVTYIRDLYQHNALVSGNHAVGGRRVDLGRISCPLLTVVAGRDGICPPAAATALNECAASTDSEVLVVPGGHVGAVIGRRARTVLYPRLTSWLQKRVRCGASKAGLAVV